MLICLFNAYRCSWKHWLRRAPAPACRDGGTGCAASREKRNPFLLHSSCSIPMAKEATYHPHRCTYVLIKLIKTVRRTGKVVLLVYMGEVFCFTRFLEVAATRQHFWILRAVLMRCGAYLLIVFMEALCSTPAFREKRNIFILHLSCSTPVVKEAPTLSIQRHRRPH